MKKLIIAISSAAIILTGTLTAFAVAGNGNYSGGNCPYGYENCVNHENCPYNGERPLDGTGMKNGQNGGGHHRGGRGMGGNCVNGVCPYL